MPSTANNQMTDPKQKEKDKLEIKRLRSTHYLYDEYKDEWEFNLAAYEGGEAFGSKDNLFQHTRENPQDYDARVKKINVLNYCKPITDFFPDFIYADTIQRDGGKNSEFFTEFITDVDNSGHDITDFMHSQCIDADIFGTSYVIADSPKFQEGLSALEQKEKRIRPYWVAVRPQEILDWVANEFGHFVYVKRVQVIDSLVGSSRKRLEHYTEWYADSITTTDVDITNPKEEILLPPEELPNHLGEVPIVPLRFEISKTDKQMGVPTLRGYAKNQRQVMNLTSLIDEFLYKQAFNILAMEYEQALPLAGQREGSEGTSNTLLYPRGAKAPAYIAPDPSPYDKLKEEREFIISEMYRRAAQNTINDLFNGGRSSGMSKAMSFSTTVPKIATKADILERAEKELMRLTLLYADKKWDGTIKYKDHYEITNLTDALTQLQIIFRDLQLRSETFLKSQLKRIVHEYDGKQSVEEIKSIEDEIDAMDADKYFANMTDSFIGAPKSPADQQKPKSTGTTAELVAESEKKPTATKTVKGTGPKAKAA